MDQTTQTLPARAPAAESIDVVQEQRDSRFERLEKEHTAKRARLKQEYEARRAQIEAQLREEAENSDSRLKTNIKKIQRALVAIEESVESTITKRVRLHLEKDLLCREHEVMMKKAAADLHDKVYDLITQAALLETVSASPCTADASNDHHFFESRAELHPMPPHGYDTSPSNQSLPPGTNHRASTPQSYPFQPTRQATTSQTSRSPTSTRRNAPVKMPIPTANIRSQNYKSIAPSPAQPTLQVRPQDRNSESSFSARLPRAESFSRGPMGDVPQQRPGLLSVSNTPDNQKAKRKAAELSTVNGASHAMKRQRANNAAAVTLHASTSQPTVDQRDNASQPSNFMQERITQRVITFEELYQDGEAEYKHKIFKHKEGSDDWYIVKCDEHNMHFGFDNPVHGAAKHIHSSQHGKMPMKHDFAVQVCGFLVKDCTDELAEKNNDVFAKELERGYQVLKPKSLSRGSQAKPRRVKPADHTVLSEANRELNDEGSEDLTTGVESTRQSSDCIIIPAAGSSEAESATNVDDVCGDESDGEDVDASPSVADYSPRAPNSGRISTEKQRAYRVASATALVNHQWSQNAGVLVGVKESAGNLGGDVTDREEVGHTKEDAMNNYKRFDALQAQMRSEAGSR